ncbi:MAG: RidA family protein [Alphaproteobacteria bacterium]
MSDDRGPVYANRPWPERYTFVPAMRVGRMVWISGTTATDDDGRIVAPGDIAGQTRQIFRKFEKLLQSLGGSCDDIVETTDYYITTDNYKATADVRREFFRQARPASTGVQVAGLLRDGALIEIKAVAVLKAEPV